MEPSVFLGYPIKGNACALSIPCHKQYPFDSLDQNNLAHVFIEYPKHGIVLFVGFGKAMQYPSMFQVMEPNVFWGCLAKGNTSALSSFGHE